MPYTPGETAERLGVSIDTIRYYEKIGLLHGIQRNSSGRRIFSDDDLSRLGLLRCLRDSGMPISRLRRFAELLRIGDEGAEQRTALLREHDQEIDARIEQLRREQRRVREKIAWYESRPDQ